MSQCYRPIASEFHRTPLTPKPPRQSTHNPLKHTPLFLTDTPTDQTSNQHPSPQVERLQLHLHRLEKQNAALKDTILQMKASEFYGIDQQKVKALILENEEQRGELQRAKEKYERSMVQKDFLERNNRVLRSQYEEFARQNALPSYMLTHHSRLKTEQSHISNNNDYQIQTNTEQPLLLKQKQKVNTLKSKRSPSTDKSKGVSRSLRRKTPNIPVRQQRNPQSRRKGEQNSSSQASAKFNQDYYYSRQGRTSLAQKENWKSHPHR